jgi:hypothetical protein
VRPPSIESLAFQLGTFVAGMVFEVERSDRRTAAVLLREVSPLARQLALGPVRVPQLGDDLQGAIRRELLESKGEKVADNFSLGYEVSAPTDWTVIETLARQIAIPEEIWREPYDLLRTAPSSSARLLLINAFARYYLTT